MHDSICTEYASYGHETVGYIKHVNSDGYTFQQRSIGKEENSRRMYVPNSVNAEVLITLRYDIKKADDK